MAVKETLARELDRKRASPTESAVMREMVKGTLRSRYAEPGTVLFISEAATSVGISVWHTLRAKRGDIAFSSQCGWYRGNCFMTKIPSRNM